MRQLLVFNIGYVCQIPQEGGGRAYLANSLVIYYWQFQGGVSVHFIY